MTQVATKKKHTDRQAVDMTGVDIKIGEIVAANPRSKWMEQIYIGKVTRFTQKGVEIDILFPSSSKGTQTLCNDNGILVLNWSDDELTERYLIDMILGE